MNDFASLSRRGQLGRLRRLGRTALASYGLEDARLTLQLHKENTTFRVEAHGGPYVLRINRPLVHTPDTIASELACLRLGGVPGTWRVSQSQRDPDRGDQESDQAAREGRLTAGFGSTTC